MLQNVSTSRLIGRPRSHNLWHLRRIGTYVRRHPIVVLLTILILLVSAAAELAVGQGVRLIVDRGFSAANTDTMNRSFAVVAAIAVVFAVASQLGYLLITWLSERAVTDLRQDLFCHVVGLDAVPLSRTSPSEVQARLTSDTIVIQHVLAGTAATALRSVCVFFGAAVLLLVTSVRLAVLVIVCLPVLILPAITMGSLIRRLTRRAQDRLATAGACAEEAVRAIHTVQAFNQEDYERKRFNQATELARRTVLRCNLARALLIGVLILCLFLLVIGVLWVGARDLMTGRLTAGQLTAFVVYAWMVATSIWTMSEIWTDCQRAAGAAERIFELLDTPARIVSPVHPVAFPAPSRGEIELENVYFTYPSRIEPALCGFNLCVPAGEMVALVGPSGAGKSTVFYLLERFYDPQQGTIRIDGVDLRQADPRQVRARIGMVPQDPVVFNTDPGENIRYGRLQATDEEVRGAARAAAAHEFIEALPQGYHTPLGENGSRLSGGQRQRMAIARSVLRDAPILLLDEATSSLDSENERLVQDAIQRLAGTRSTIIIAHRLSTVLKANRIVIMDAGRIVAIGKHHELLQQCPLYARLAQLQFFAARNP